MKKLKKNNMQRIYTHIVKNAREYFSLIIFLFIGIVVGIIVINNSNESQISEIQNYIGEFVDNISKSENIDKLALLKEIFFKNLFFLVLLIIIGSTVIGVPIIYIIIGYKGFCLSYTISSLIAVLGPGKGVIFSIFSIFLQNLIYIPCILALGVCDINLYKSIIKEKNKDNIKLGIFKHILISSFIGIFFLFGSFVETYVSTSLISMYAKFL